MRPVIVLTTVGAGFDAAALSRELVELHLAACVNIVEQIRSIYRWEGRVEDDSEQLLVIKTVEEQIGPLRDILFARHPYEVPEFVVVPIERIEGPYHDWLIAAVSPS
ncbi:MAG TPA: divalent-cation tolerance protein CutA [Thermoanaerobaculia bacterium]|nr:divalent-cation tolerance protein CutA [Thermoanaerobaculia bacterium]